MKVYVESKDQIIEKRADSRGRVTLGSEYVNKEVQLAVLEVNGDESNRSVELLTEFRALCKIGRYGVRVAQGGFDWWVEEMSRYWVSRMDSVALM